MSANEVPVLTPIVGSPSGSADNSTEANGGHSNGLVGIESHDTVASVDISKSGPHPRSLKTALDAVGGLRRNRGYSNQSSTSEEDYDTLRPDPKDVIPGGRGGGFEPTRPVLSSLRHVEDSTEEIKTDFSEQTIDTDASVRQRSQTKLRKASQDGKYYLLTDDTELKELLQIKTKFQGQNDSERPRRKFSDMVFTRQFTAFDRQNRESAESPFHGFFILFWLGVFIFVMQTAFKNWEMYGHVFGTNEIMGMMTDRDLLVLLISDGILCGSTGFGWIVQKLVSKGYLSWNQQGWIIQNLWQTFYMFLVLSWTMLRKWPWTHTVFFVLHSLVMLMKQHSYAFYNGHLSEVYKRRQSLLHTLKALQDTVPIQSPSQTSPAVSALSTSYLKRDPSATEINQRRRDRSGNSMESGSEDINQVVVAIESGESLDTEQIQTFERMIKWEVDALAEELQGKSSTSSKSYPNNLTLKNHYEYIVLPTLVYELEYPRTDSIDWSYVLEKAAASVGVLFIMMLVSQTYIYPIVMRTVEMKNQGLSLDQRMRHFPKILSELVLPFMMEYLMTWYVLFESILNLLAELTYFADRGFYADWWNSVSWDQFARDWNKPVHVFLLRHVYHSSISFMHVNKHTATLITFLLSALVHELIMWCLFKKLRGYLLILQMSQIPLVQLSRTKWLKGRATLGNLIFWMGLFAGPSLLCSLYLIL